MPEAVAHSRALISSIGGKRLVIAAGMIRSGSTWLYNAARLCHQVAGAEVYGTWIADFDPVHLRGCDCVVVKVHDPDHDLMNRADRILTCHRDLREVVRSAQDMGWPTSGVPGSNMLANATASHSFWAASAHIDLKYEDLVRDQEVAVEAVSRALGLVVESGQLTRLVAALERLSEPPSSGPYDPVTLIHPKHRSGNTGDTWNNAIDVTVVQHIERTYGAWLASHGYPVGTAHGRTGTYPAGLA